MTPWIARARRGLPLAGAVFIAVALTGLFVLQRAVRQALDAPRSDRRPLRFVALPPPPVPLPHWGGSGFEAVAAAPGGLITAGGFGVRGEGRDLSAGLPTLRAASLALWRGRPVVALAAGGFFLRRGAAWEEARSAWGTLHVRALVETPAGELLVGAREGLFRTAWGADTLVKLDGHPVRSVAVRTGQLLAGGEEGLYRIEPRPAVRLETPEPWIEWVGFEGDRLWSVTAAGLVSGPADGPLQAVPGGEAVASGITFDNGFWGVMTPPAPAVLRLRGAEKREEPLPSPPRRLFAAGGSVFADTEAGLLRRSGSGWVPAGDPPAALPPAAAHVGALAEFGSRIVVGFFDGGLATAERGRWEWREVPGALVWGVNALLPAGGALYVASLRGAARYDGARVTPLAGPGAAYSLAATDDGVAIGYGQGVLLPGARLLSAFHGLPGNQALALASGESLVVATASGLGAIRDRRVVWRATAGEGKLPHPWVTALARQGDTLYAGTYGGGVVRRTKTGDYEPFPETDGLRINAGCLVEAAGRLYAGTDGRGLYRLSEDRRRFEKLELPLPSPRITALLGAADGLYVGTDEGLARVSLQ